MTRVLCPHCGEVFEYYEDEHAVSGIPPKALVERVARALWARTVEVDPDVGGEWESASPEWREQYLALADAAVQEIWGSEG